MFGLCLRLDMTLNVISSLKQPALWRASQANYGPRKASLPMHTASRDRCLLNRDKLQVDLRVSTTHGHLWSQPAFPPDAVYLLY
jgi:hypothetical protein